ISIIPNVIGSIKPFKAPAKINKVAGFPINAIISVDIAINAIIKYFSYLSIKGFSVFKKETDV
ncbi:hypothetical protein, partial [Enterobacter roggenkampii]|uniref:hypothetical protein n=1 Tax=Enterobacter roggenkampii TaxID=1812935 RepID=UPI00197B0723